MTSCTRYPRIIKEISSRNVVYGIYNSIYLQEIASSSSISHKSVNTNLVQLGDLFERSLRVCTILVALCCTASILRICFLWVGDQITPPYSRIGLTIVQYRFINILYQYG